MKDFKVRMLASLCRREKVDQERVREVFGVKTIRDIPDRDFDQVCNCIRLLAGREVFVPDEPEPTCLEDFSDEEFGPVRRRRLDIESMRKRRHLRLIKTS